jgi:transcriptional regulator with XRE-family HTH domain
MKISEYIQQAGMTVAETARSFGCKHQTMQHWVKGDRIPRPATMKKIQAWTGGKVGPKDFYDDE